jgi:predicted GIY-YIG superfamily endonuclease
MTTRHNNVMGLIYLVHLDKPLHHAKHYLGWCESFGLENRLHEHRTGQGSKLLRAVNEAGIGYQVVKTWRGTRSKERQMKRWKCTPRLCPVCRTSAQGV